MGLEYAIVSNKLADAASWMEMREGEDFFRVAISSAIAEVRYRVSD